MHQFGSLKGHSDLMNHCWVSVGLHLREPSPAHAPQKALGAETIRNEDTGLWKRGVGWSYHFIAKESWSPRGQPDCQGHPGRCRVQHKAYQRAYKIRLSTVLWREIFSWSYPKVRELKLLILVLSMQHRRGYPPYSNIFQYNFDNIIIIISFGHLLTTQWFFHYAHFVLPTTLGSR